MSASLAAKIRREASELQAMFNALGAVESIFFRGVGPGGYDFYGVKFANGFAEFRLLLGADGKAEDVIFRADGDDAPGGVVACSEERDLKSRAGTAPVHVLFYNATGAGIQLYKLNSEGKRTAAGHDRREHVVVGPDFRRQSLGRRRRVGEMSRDRAAWTDARVTTRSRRAGGRWSAPAVAAHRRRWPEAKRCCASTSRPSAAANRTTIA